MGTAKGNEGRVYILLLNWNGWKDTIECLESIFRNDYPNYRVIVCDNDSKDGSIEYIKAWANSQLNIVPPSNRILSGKVGPPVNKPISFTCYDRLVAENGGDIKDDSPLTLIQTGKNLGFAGGNNVGLRYVMARHDGAYVWLLNNDTIICEDSLSKMVERSLSNSLIGICGSTVCYYDNPLMTQSMGGCTYNKWFGIAKNIGYMKSISELSNVDVVEKNMDYVLGASMLVSSNFLSTIGLMNESYFLYCEEIDWATRAFGKFTLGYAPLSVVYHKEGASIGSKSSFSQKLRYRSEYYLVKSRIKFTRRHFEYAVPTIYLGFILTIIVRLLRGQWARAAILVKVLLNKDTPNVE
jgi:GT2 family glycosyltransferase